MKRRRSTGPKFNSAAATPKGLSACGNGLKQRSAGAASELVEPPRVGGGSRGVLSSEKRSQSAARAAARAALPVARKYWIQQFMKKERDVTLAERRNAFGLKLRAALNAFETRGCNIGRKVSSGERYTAIVETGLFEGKSGRQIAQAITKNVCQLFEEETINHASAQLRRGVAGNRCELN